MRLACLLLVWLLAWPAAAQVDFSQVRDVARVKAEEGLALYAEQRWQEAYEHFRVAEELFHAPTLVLHMAHCQRELGKLRDARELYRKVVDEPLPEGASAAFRDAQATAKSEMDKIDARIPRIRIAVSGATNARVTLDGREAALEPNEIEVDPGPHRVEATAPGAETYNKEIDVPEGARQRVDVAMRRLPERRPPPPPPRPPPEPEPGPLWPAGIAMGVGVAGFALGGIAGGIVMSRVSDIQAQCNGNDCPLSLESEADDLRPIAAASNAGFVIGGVGLITAVVLFIVRPGGGAPSAALELGPASATIRGSF